MTNRRGVSPIIATVLLVAFVIVISVMVLAWIRSGIEAQQEKATEQITSATECYSTEISIPSASDKGVCKINDNQIKIVVDNDGKKEVLKLTVRILYGQEAEVFEEDLTTDPLETFNRKIITRTLSTSGKTAADITSIEIIPHIVEGTCPDNSERFKPSTTGLLTC